MNIRKQRIISTLMLLILLVMWIKIDVKAEDSLEVEKDKIWKITFNREIRYDDRAVSSINVVDENGEKVKVRLEFGDDEKTILVKPPIRGYVEGETYTLNVERNIYSKFNIKLSKRNQKTFTIKSNDPFVDMVTVNSEDNIKAEGEKIYIFNKLDKVTDSEGKALKEIGWKSIVYKLKILNKSMSMIYSSGSAKEFQVPLKLNGLLGVYVGYESTTEEFKVICNGKEELIKVDKNSGEVDKNKWLNESFVTAGDFNEDTIKIVPIEGKKAKIAYIKMVSLNQKQINAYSRAKEGSKVSKVVYDNDGYTDFFWGKYPDIASLERFPVNLNLKTNAKEINWTLGTTGFLNYNSEYAGKAFEGFEKYEDYVRKGDKLAKEQILNILDQGKSPLEVVASKGDELGVEVSAALRMNAFYLTDFTRFLNGKMYDEYQDCLQSNGYSLSYYYPKFRNYIFNVLKEASAIKGVDGITLDFCRYPNVIGSEASYMEKISIMNDFMRMIRKEIPNKKITVRVPYLNPISYGLDVETWVTEGIIDRIVPSVINYEEFYNINKYLEMVDGTNVELYIGIAANLKGGDATPETEDILSNGRVPGNKYLPVEEYLFRAHEVYGKGANGIFIFNLLNELELNEYVSPKFKFLEDKNEVKRWYELEYPSYLVNYKIEWSF